MPEENRLTPEAREYIRNYLGKWVGIVAGFAGIANVGVLYVAINQISDHAKAAAESAALKRIEDNEVIAGAVSKGISDGLTRTKELGVLIGQMESQKSRLGAIEKRIEQSNEMANELSNLLNTTDSDKKTKLLRGIDQLLREDSAIPEAISALKPKLDELSEQVTSMGKFSSKVESQGKINRKTLELLSNFVTWAVKNPPNSSGANGHWQASIADPSTIAKISNLGKLLDERDQIPE